MKKVYFVRHGESQGNAGNFWQTAETPLSETGIGQAKIIAKRAANINFDLLISSPCVRAVQTAQFIADATGKEVLESGLFTERLRPSEQWKAQKDSETGRLSRENYAKAFVEGQKYKDGESFPELLDRAKEALKFLEEQNDDKILVVTHGTFLRIICAYVLLKEDLTPKTCFEMVKTFKIQNTGITLIEKKGDQAWRLNTWNDHAHFGEY